MGRKVNRRGVAEAGLFGAYQRLIDLEYRSDLSPVDRSAHEAEAVAAVSALEAEVMAAGGTPDEVRLLVQQRELEHRARMAR